MGFGEDLKDQLPAINSFVTNGNSFGNEIRDYFKERATIERDCAHKLEQLSKKYSKQKDKLAHSLMGDSAQGLPQDIAADPSKFGSMFKAWDEFLKQAEEVAAVKIQLSDKITTEITDSLKLLFHKKDEARKKHLHFAQKVMEERTKAYTDREKSKMKYDESCDTVENSKNKYEKATDEKMKEKLKKQWNSDIMEMNNIKNNYLMAVQVANAFKKKYYYSDMPWIMDMMQEMNEDRLKQMKTICEEYVRLENQAISSILEKTTKMMESFSSIVPEVDSSLFIQYHKSTWQEPYDFKFEPTLLWKDTDSLVTDDHAKIYLSNKVAKIGARLEAIEQEISAKNKELEGLTNLFDAYTKNPSTGNAGDILENIIEAKRALALMEGTKTRYTSTLSVISQSIGDADIGKRHTLVKSSFAIPTTCDYCQEKIWGLTQLGLTCKECGYNCHAKCEMKVPPNCTSVKGGGKSRTSSVVTSPPSNSQQSRSTSNPIPSVSSTLPAGDKIARVIYEYEAVNADELSIEIGDRLKVLTLDDGTGWLKAEKDGKKGLVPSAYIELTENFISRSPSTNALKMTTATAIYDYDAANPDELSIKSGEQVKVIQADDGSGWMKAEKNGKQGLLPAAYVEIAN